MQSSYSVFFGVFLSRFGLNVPIEVVKEIVAWQKHVSV